MPTDRRRGVLTAAAALFGAMPLASISLPHVPALELRQHIHTSADTLPSFDRVLYLEPKGETSANVSAGDVNGDGHLDLVLAKGRHWPLVDRVLLGDGAGRFQTGYDLGPAADRSYSGLLVDVDRDGDLDVIISNDEPDPKRVYLNDGKGRYREGSTYGRPEWPTRNATAADVNGDGYPDIVAANRGDSTTANYVCLNQGHGRFDADCAAFSREPATTIAAADFNGDGMTDLAVPYRDRGQSRVYVAAAKGSFSAARIIPFGPPNAAIRVADAADLNGDGLLDIVAIDDGKRTTTIYFAQRDRTFSSGTAVGDAAVMPYALATADVNGDGKTDIVVGNVEAPSTVWFNDGTGQHFQAVRFGDSEGTVYGFAIADVDGDGMTDIAAARSDARNVIYFGSRPKSPSRGSR